MRGFNYPATYDRSVAGQLAMACENPAFLSEEEPRYCFARTTLAPRPISR
jgi:hypothetical protein